MRLFVASLCLIFWQMLAASARPVSYPGGWTLIQENDMAANGLHIHHSPSAQHSVGYRGIYWRDKAWQFHGVQFNRLAKRWNAPNAQANLYIKLAAGMAANDTTDAIAAFGGIAFDWENRRFFTAYENRGLEAGEIDNFFAQKLRFGVAPYIGDYGDTHTWLMLQVDHTPQAENELTLTPLVRLFKGAFLTELGITDRGDVLFNWTFRF